MICCGCLRIVRFEGLIIACGNASQSCRVRSGTTGHSRSLGYAAMPVDWPGGVGLRWEKDSKIDLQPVIIQLSARKLPLEKNPFACNGYPGEKA